MRQLRTRINEPKNWITEQTENAEQNLQNVISDILNGRGDRNCWQKTTDLKTAARVLVFLQSNSITELPQLREKVSEMARTVRQRFRQAEKDGAAA